MLTAGEAMSSSPSAPEAGLGDTSCILRPLRNACDAFTQDKATGGRFVHVNEADVYQDANGTQYCHVSTIEIATKKVRL